MSLNALNVPLSCFLLTVMLHMGAIRLTDLIDSQTPLEEPRKSIPVNIDTMYYFPFFCRSLTSQDWTSPKMVKNSLFQIDVIILL